jgi:Ca2+-transporting ATPase
MPLSAVQILYVNLATDGLPALALAVDPAERDLMRRPPRNARGGVFTRPVVVLMVAGGVWSAVLNTGLFLWGRSQSLAVEQCMTLVFISLIVIEFLKAYSFRSDRHSVFRRPFANGWLNLAIVWELLLLGAILTVPALSRLLGTHAVPLSAWLVVAGSAITIVPVLEGTKWMIRRGWVRDAS